MTLIQHIKYLYFIDKQFYPVIWKLSFLSFNIYSLFYLIRFILNKVMYLYLLVFLSSVPSIWQKILLRRNGTVNSVVFVSFGLSVCSPINTRLKYYYGGMGLPIVFTSFYSSYYRGTIWTTTDPLTVIHSVFRTEQLKTGKKKKTSVTFVQGPTVFSSHRTTKNRVRSCFRIMFWNLVRFTVVTPNSSSRCT